MDNHRINRRAAVLYIYSLWLASIRYWLYQMGTDLQRLVDTADSCHRPAPARAQWPVYCFHARPLDSAAVSVSPGRSARVTWRLN